MALIRTETESTLVVRTVEIEDDALAHFEGLGLRFGIGGLGNLGQEDEYSVGGIGCESQDGKGEKG